MSVGDIKGSRRRFRLRQQSGQAPRKAGLTVSQLITKNARLAARQAKTARVKK